MRRWLEHEIARSFGGPPASPLAGTDALIGSNVEEARDMLALVRAILLPVSVFFKLGREAASVTVPGLRAFALPTSCASPGCKIR